MRSMYDSNVGLFDELGGAMNTTSVVANDTTTTFGTFPPTEAGSPLFTEEPHSVVHIAFHVDILLVFAGVVFMVLIRVFLEYLNSDNLEGRFLIRHRERHVDTDESGIQKLLVEDWVFLYNKTFRSNPNRLVLKKEHISNTISEDSEYDFEDFESTSMETSMKDTSIKIGEQGFEDLESASPAEDPKSKPEGYLSSSYNMLLEAFAGRLSTNTEPKNIPPIGGGCVICFENFKVGDEVVWSASNNELDDSDTDTQDENKKSHHNKCQHVYHQECMVQYLANHSHRKFRKQSHFEGSLDIETPCPTCRRNFCVLNDEDISLAIKTRCLLLGSETSSNSGDEDSQEISPSNSSESESTSPQPQPAEDV